jgi:Tol biopolymer transport system component
MREKEFGTELRTGAYAISTSTTPTAAAAIRQRGDRRRRRNALASGALAFLIGAGGGGVAYASFSHPVSGGSSPPAAAGGTGRANGAPGVVPGGSRPGIVAVTTGGAVEVLNSTTGIVTATLTGMQDAIGDEVAVSPSGQTVYFAVNQTCGDKIESVPIGGGKPTVITSGVLPAVSPDGTELAFVRESYSGGPSEINYTCGAVNQTKKAEVVVRDLANGSEQAYPAPPNALTWPVSHVSWSPDGETLLVSAGPATGTQSWDLLALNLASAKYYAPLSPGTAGNTDIQPGQGSGDYYREGAYLPDNDIFVNQLCCTSSTSSNGKIMSSLLLEISPSGQQVRQVAEGDLTRDHTSLDATKGWLLYLSGNDLFVSDDGATPVALSSGFIAAAWIPGTS